MAATGRPHGGLLRRRRHGVFFAKCFDYQLLLSVQFFRRVIPKAFQVLT